MAWQCRVRPVTGGYMTFEGKKDKGWLFDEIRQLERI